MAEKLSKEDIELFNFIINDPESGEAEKKIAREVLEKDNSLKEKPKSTKATPKKKSVSKKTSKPKMSDIEKKKMEILKKTGKTEEECKKIIEQYRALKSEAVTKRKKDTKRKIVAKKRTAKLKKEGKTIQGTTEKNVEATLDTTSKKVVKKIDKEIDKIEKTSKTEKQVEKKISSLVTQAVRSNKKLLSDTAKELAKVDKNNAKQYLLSLKKEIETLLSKYAYGGSVERRGHGGMMHSQGYNDRLDESLGNRNRVEPLMMQSFKDRRDESKGMEKSMGRRPYSSVGSMDRMAKGGEIKFRKLAKSKNFDIVTDEGRYEIEMGAFGIPKSIIVGDTRKDINTNPIAKKYRKEIQEYLDKNYAKGGEVDDVIMIKIGGDKKFPYYIKKIDTTHIAMANNKDGVDIVTPSNILQHRGEKYYNDVRSWLKGGTSPNGKSYDSDYYAKGGMMKSQGYNDRLDESLGNRNRVEPLMMQSFKDRRDESKGMEKSMGRRPYSSVGTMDKMAKGGIVRIAQDNDNENYDDFRNKDLRIVSVAYNTSDHRGYDEGMGGMALYDLEVAETGEEVPFSLYEYEVEEFAKGGKIREYAVDVDTIYDQYRDGLTFDTYDEALKVYNEIISKDTYNNRFVDEELDNVQLIEVYNDGDYSTLLYKDYDNVPKAKGKRVQGGRIYQVKDYDEFDKWYDTTEFLYGKFKENEVRYVDDGVYIRDDIYKGSDSLNRDNLYAKGGKIGFDGLARKVAKRYEGEPVPKRFQKEYGKTYSKAEALEVGKKVAGKVLREQNAKMEAGGTLPTPFGQAGLVGETGTLNEVDLFAMGGTLPQGVHQYYAQTYNPAYPTPFGYARGGAVSNKIYELKYYFVDITEDDYQMGEGATVQSFTSDDMQQTNMKFESKGKALDFVANVIERDTEQYPNESNLLVEETEKKGHYSITYSTLSVYNMGNYERPSESQYESWKKGEMRLYSVIHHFVFDVYMKQPSSEFAHGGMMHSQGYNDRLDESLGNRNRVEPLMMQSFKDRRDESKGMEKSMGRRPYSSVGTMDKMAKGGRIKVGDAVISMKDNFPNTISGMGKRQTGIVQELIKGDDGGVAIVEASNNRRVYAKAKNLETLDTLITSLEKGGMMKSQGYNDKLDDSLGSSNGKRSKKQQNYKDRRDESEAMAKKGGRRKYSRVKTMDKGNRKKRKTPMTLAKEIRKEGEKWQDAVKRASAMLKNK